MRICPGDGVGWLSFGVGLAGLAGHLRVSGSYTMASAPNSMTRRAASVMLPDRDG